MKEIFDFKDKNIIFNKMNNMHDFIISNLQINEKKITFQFNKLINSDYDSCVIDYILEENIGVDLFAKKIGSKKEIFYCDEYGKINAFCDNSEMIMFKFSVDTLNYMDIEFILTKKKKSYNVNLRFSPSKIVYNWKKIKRN